jgi:hypothetical protein
MLFQKEKEKESYFAQACQLEVGNIMLQHTGQGSKVVIRWFVLMIDVRKDTNFVFITAKKDVWGSACETIVLHSSDEVKCERYFGKLV